MRKYLLLITLVFFVNGYSQNTFQNDFNGVWKLKSLEKNDTSIDFTEYIKFVNNEIHFLKMNSGIEKLMFIKKVEFENINYIETRIRFENGEVWELFFRNINNEKRLIWRITVDKNGDRREQADERSFIRNKDNRKKALEGEINTYYIKVE